MNFVTKHYICRLIDKKTVIINDYQIEGHQQDLL
jgi:hypothetical protein